MPKIYHIEERREQLPVLHVRGTHYQVGVSIGRTFASLIKRYLQEWRYFEEDLLPAYKTPGGQRVYEETLTVCQRRFPHYVEEMRGIAEGAEIPFHNIFLLHIEALMDPNNTGSETKSSGALGCTAVMMNVENNVILGHTEDAPVEMTNHFFIVSAQVLGESGEVLESFSTLTYPGYLPGYTMGYNCHGLVYCVNAIFPERTYSGRTPVYFLARSILGAKNIDEALSILKDEGSGIADGFTLNLISAKEEHGPIVANIEVGPNPRNEKESQISVHYVNKGSSFVHCNRYLRLDIPEVQGSSFRSSCHRHDTIGKLSAPQTTSDVKRILSDESDKFFPVYRTPTPEQLSDENTDEGKDYASTIAVGVFDVLNKTWAIYSGPPASSDPVVVFPMAF